MLLTQLKQSAAEKIHRAIAAQTSDQPRLSVWAPAVNAERAFGRWGFLEIDDLLTTKSAMRGCLIDRQAIAH